MKLFASFTLLLLLSPYAISQHHAAKEQNARLMSGLGRVHHPVSTKNPIAQKFFDQGLAFIYAFNHEEAAASFKRAGQLDPKLAMAFWGIALAVGPNYNLDVDADREKQAYEAIQKARSLAAKAPQRERDYIEALATRYTDAANADFKKLALDYKNAMGELTKRYPND